MNLLQHQSPEAALVDNSLLVKSYPSSYPAPENGSRLEHLGRNMSKGQILQEVIRLSVSLL